MNRRELLKKIPGAMVGGGLIAAMGKTAGANESRYITIKSITARHVLWQCLDTKTGKSTYHWMETHWYIDPEDGTRTPFARDVGSLGLFWQTAENARHKPFLVSSRTFHPKFDRLHPDQQ